MLGFVAGYSLSATLLYSVIVFTPIATNVGSIIIKEVATLICEKVIEIRMTSQFCLSYVMLLHGIIHVRYEISSLICYSLFFLDGECKRA